VTLPNPARRFQLGQAKAPLGAKRQALAGQHKSSEAEGPSDLCRSKDPRLERLGGAAWRAMVLTERDRAILDFERSWWSEPGRKELAIRERFDLSTTRYYGILNELLDAPEALEYDPLVVRRLRRVRDRRRRARFEGRSMIEPRQ
jgi:hypothetical protein